MPSKFCKNDIVKVRIPQYNNYETHGIVDKIVKVNDEFMHITFEYRGRPDGITVSSWGSKHYSIEKSDMDIIQFKLTFSELF